ncbi:hypothetical protein OIO90_004374 [Microbotryomycetes sp. JL221]|nr:hypothetical protein OIO90_004374 [Microbotryomycetes sp. JL221]
MSNDVRLSVPDKETHIDGSNQTDLIVGTTSTSQDRNSEATLILPPDQQTSHESHSKLQDYSAHDSTIEPDVPVVFHVKGIHNAVANWFSHSCYISRPGDESHPLYYLHGKRQMFGLRLALHKQNEQGPIVAQSEKLPLGSSTIHFNMTLKELSRFTDRNGWTAKMLRTKTFSNSFVFQGPDGIMYKWKNHFPCNMLTVGAFEAALYRLAPDPTQPAVGQSSSSSKFKQAPKQDSQSSIDNHCVIAQIEEQKSLWNKKLQLSIRPGCQAMTDLILITGLTCQMIAVEDMRRSASTSGLW